jgi:hypothetical protein
MTDDSISRVLLAPATLMAAAALLCGGCSGKVDDEPKASLTSDTGSAGADADASPGCGGCSGDRAICDRESGRCVECTSNQHCGGDRPVCETDSGACVECLPAARTKWFVDKDGDGFGADGGRSQRACQKPGEGWAGNAEDCNDDDSAVNPRAMEVCNGKDDDCDGSIDDNDGSLEPADCAKQKGV